MEIKVKLSNLRTAPRKSRQLIDLVRGKKVAEAQAILLFTTSKTALPVLKLLNSAVATATHDLHLESANLFISAITSDEGPKMKRWHPMSRGRAFPIIKRSSHIALTLKEIVPTDKGQIKAVKTAKQPETKLEKIEVKTVKKEVKAKKTTKKTK